MKRRITGRYWAYTGNSINGKDHERRTPRGYTLNDVALVAAIADDCNGYGDGQLARLVTSEEAKQIEITHHKGDGFGHEITVKAPKSVWEKAKKYSKS